MNTIEHLQATGLFHWLCALLGIICFAFIRISRVKVFYLNKWFNENLIPTLWSLFFLSLIVTLTFTYYKGYSMHEAFLFGYAGSHVIAHLCKVEPTKKHSIKHKHEN